MEWELRNLKWTEREFSAYFNRMTKITERYTDVCLRRMDTIHKKYLLAFYTKAILGLK